MQQFATEFSWYMIMWRTDKHTHHSTSRLGYAHVKMLKSFHRNYIAKRRQLAWLQAFFISACGAAVGVCEVFAFGLLSS